MKNDTDKIIRELLMITNLGTIKELMKNTKPLKTNLIAVKEFYLATGRFPNKEEDCFLYEYGFTNWYNAYRSDIFKNPDPTHVYLVQSKVSLLNHGLFTNEDMAKKYIGNNDFMAIQKVPLN